MPRTTLSLLILWISTGIAGLCSSTTMANEIAIRPYTAQYLLFRKGSEVGVGSVRLAPLNDNKWSFGTESSASILFFSAQDSEQTTFAWNGDRPRPILFTKKMKLPFKDRFTEQSFDWAKRIETGKNEKKHWQIPLENDVLDVQSQLLALQLDLANGKKTFEYRVSKKGAIKNYRYEIIQHEPLDTLLGKLDTVRVERVHDKDDDRATITWFSPQHQFIPVRLQFFDEGEEEGDLRIKSIQLSARQEN